MAAPAAGTVPPKTPPTSDGVSAREYAWTSLSAPAKNPPRPCPSVIGPVAVHGTNAAGSAWVATSVPFTYSRSCRAAASNTPVTWLHVLSGAACGERTVTATTPRVSPLADFPSWARRFRAPVALVGFTHAATVKLRAVSSTGPVVAIAELVPLNVAAPPRSVVQVTPVAAPVLLPPVSRAVVAPAVSASRHRAIGASAPLWTVWASGRPNWSCRVSDRDTRPDGSETVCATTSSSRLYSWVVVRRRPAGSTVDVVVRLAASTANDTVVTPLLVTCDSRFPAAS
ncbi:hypothetical protein GCM10009558_052470 [Virgisporangium aurantiacum]